MTTQHRAIYGIVSANTGAIYVGHTAFLMKRARQHYNDLWRGDGINPRLQAAFDHSAVGSLRFVVLEEPAPGHTLLACEARWVAVLALLASGGIYNFHRPIRGAYPAPHYKQPARRITPPWFVVLPDADHRFAYWHMQPRRDTPIEDRFWPNITVTEQGCWIFHAEQQGAHYRSTTTGNRRDGTRRRVMLHRWAYERYRGAIPRGKVIDHAVCDNPPCCNPWHLEIATPVENVMRSMAQPAINARKTRCHQGHALEGDNLYVNPVGARQCRICRRRRGRRSAANRRARDRGGANAA